MVGLHYLGICLKCCFKVGHRFAGMMELVDVPHSKCGGEIHVGSSPTTGTTLK